MDRSQLTPLFVQYYDLKDAHPGCLMLMRVGDFFEAYGEDAESLSRDADIALTAKEAGGGQRLAMAGVPFFALEPYLRVLIEKGNRVAIADQMELASQTKGLVRREVTRVVTAGTVLDPQMLDEQRYNYLLCLVAGADEVGLAACDITTGDFLCTQLANDGEGELSAAARVSEEIYRFRPSEILVCGEPAPWTTALVALARNTSVGAVVERELDDPLPAGGAAGGEALMLRQFRWRSLAESGLEPYRQATAAVTSLLEYLMETTRSEMLSLERPRYYSLADHMVLDTTTLRNLELVETLIGRERKGSLLWAMDYTVTAMGARLLRQWMTRPLLEVEAIHERSLAVQTLCQDYYRCGQIRQALHPVKDIERLLARVVYQSANARDLLALHRSLAVLPASRRADQGWPEVPAWRSPETVGLADHLFGLETRTFEELRRELAVDPDLLDLLQRAIADEPPQTLREGGMIRTGYHAGLDELREARSSAKSWIAALEEREREASGIRTLKVGYNQVFGYYLEITRAHQKSVPPHYIRKQTLANAERYFTPELKEIEGKVLGAEEKIRDLEYELFMELRQRVALQAEPLRQAARAVAQLDLLAGLAEAAVRHRWVRPEMVRDNVLTIQGGRHPVVERCVDSLFVPNDCRLDGEKRLVVLTGPNMSGKSTYLRQNALIVIMAQMGSFVPAERAVLGIHDRVFTRVGASDDLHLGQSTFMVEMSEAANILLNATPRSLVILDEIGRGTSTYDGLALAQAIAEFLYNQVRAKTLFATHFHELTSLARERKGILNQRVAVQENRDQIVFLHRIVPGGADRSYGIYVAQLAGLPQTVLDRAHSLLAQLEKGARAGTRAKAPELQLSLFAESLELNAELRRLELGRLSGAQALEILRSWQEQVLQLEGNPPLGCR